MGRGQWPLLTSRGYTALGIGDGVGRAGHATVLIIEIGTVRHSKKPTESVSWAVLRCKKSGGKVTDTEFK